MKHITLLFAISTFIIVPLRADWQEGVHVGSAIAALGLSAAAGISGICAVKHKRQLEELRKQLTQFEGHPLQTIYLDNKAQLRLKKSRLATVFFASTAVVSIIAWLLTLQKNSQTPGASNPHNPLVTPVKDRQRTVSGATITDTPTDTPPSTALHSAAGSRRGSGATNIDLPSFDEVEQVLAENGVDLDPMYSVDEKTQKSRPATPELPVQQAVTPPLPSQPPTPLVTQAHPRVDLSAPPVLPRRKTWDRPQSPQLVQPVAVVTMQHRGFLEQLWELHDNYPCVYLFGTSPELSNKTSASGTRLHKAHPPILFDYFVSLKDPEHHEQISSWDILERVWQEDHRHIGLQVFVWHKNRKKWQHTMISDRSFGASAATGSQQLRLYSLQVSTRKNAENSPPPERFLRRRRRHFA